MISDEELSHFKKCVPHYFFVPPYFFLIILSSLDSTDCL